MLFTGYLIGLSHYTPRLVRLDRLTRVWLFRF